VFIAAVIAGAEEGGQIKVMSRSKSVCGRTIRLRSYPKPIFQWNDIFVFIISVILNILNNDY